MKKIYPLACIVLSSVLAPSVASGQLETTELESVEVDFWPEYDRAGTTLVLYRIRLLAGTDLSVPVAIPIPASVGEPHAVAWSDEHGALKLAEYTRRVEGERAMLLAKMEGLEGQLEFYFDIAIDESSRTFQFVWPGGVDVGSLSFQIQRPRGATSLQVKPEPKQQWVGGDGLQYSLLELGRQGPSETPKIDVSYDKATAALTAGDQKTTSSSVPPSPATPAAPSTGAAPETRVGSLPWWAIAVAGIAVGLLAAGAAVFLVRGRAVHSPPPPDPQPSSSAKKKKKGNKSEEAAPGEAGTVFCHECGTKGNRTDAFCMNCGTKMIAPD